MSLLKCKSRTLTDFYSFYPHRKNPPPSSTIPIPYIKASDVSNHKYALTHVEYKDIMTDIFESIGNKLLEGEVWRVGSGIGEIVLCKIKCRKFVDRIKSKAAGKTVSFAKNGYENYMVIPEWERLHYPLSNRWLWRFKADTKLKKQVYLRADEDYTYLHKFRDK